MNTEKPLHSVKDTMNIALSQKRVPITAFIPSVGAPQMVPNITSSTGVMFNGIPNESFKTSHSYASNNYVVNMPGFLLTTPYRSSGLCFPSFTAQPELSKPRHTFYYSHQKQELGASIDPYMHASLPEQAANGDSTLRYISAISSYHPAPNGLIIPQGVERVPNARSSDIVFYSGQQLGSTMSSDRYSTTTQQRTPWIDNSVTRTLPTPPCSLMLGYQGGLKRVDKTEETMGPPDKRAWTTTVEGSPVPRSNKDAGKSAHGSTRKSRHQKLDSSPPHQLLCYYWVMYGTCDGVDGDCPDFHPSKSEESVEPQAPRVLELGCNALEDEDMEFLGPTITVAKADSQPYELRANIYSLVSENKLLQSLSVTADGGIEATTQRLGDIKAKIEECLTQLATYATVVSVYQPKLKDFERPLRDAHLALQSPGNENETLVIILVLANEIYKIIRYHRGDDTVSKKLQTGHSTMKRPKRPHALDLKFSRWNFLHIKPINQHDKTDEDISDKGTEGEGNGKEDHKDIDNHEDDGNNINDILAMLDRPLINYNPER